MEAVDDTERSDRPLVRPRRVWGGLLFALVGAGLVGLGVAALSRTLAAAGAGLVLAGAAVALRGGVLYDGVTALSLRAEMRGVVAGGAHRGSRAGQMVEDARLRAAAQAATERSEAVLAAAQAARPPVLAPVAGWSLVVAVVVVVSSQWDWVARTSTGHATSSRDTVLLVVLALCGLRIGIGRGSHRISALVAGLAGAGLLLAGVFGAHDRAAAAAVELGCGSLGVLAALAALMSSRSGEHEDEDEGEGDLQVFGRRADASGPTERKPE